MHGEEYVQAASFDEAELDCCVSGLAYLARPRHALLNHVVLHSHLCWRWVYAATSFLLLVRCSSFVVGELNFQIVQLLFQPVTFDSMSAIFLDSRSNVILPVTYIYTVCLPILVLYADSRI
jgi:hypothetical protein